MPGRVATGGGAAARVKVAGSDLAGLDPASVTCAKQGGKIKIGSGVATGKQQALAVIPALAPARRGSRAGERLGTGYRQNTIGESSGIDAQQRPLTESAAWEHDWAAASVHVGAPLTAQATESPETRERVRRWARLDQPIDDVFLAEILAAESAY